MFDSRVLFALFLVASSACSGKDHPPKRVDDSYQPPKGRVPERTADFESGPCPVAAPDRLVECGYLTVPESRTSGGARTIQLAVAIAYSKNPSFAPDPVVYLVGGPGGGGLDTILGKNNPFDPLLADRDLIVFDQRGAGYSKPALACPSGTSSSSVTDSVAECAAHFRSQGIDLDAYNTAENAADLAALRIALGYPSWNLYGISYGTRLALTALRDHPEGIRAVSIDGVLPLEEDFFGHAAPNLAHSFGLLFNACADDSVCSLDFPNLEERFKQTVASLDASPPSLALSPGTVKLTGALFVQTLFQLLYSAQELAYVPALVSKAENGDYAVISQILSALRKDRQVSDGMYLAIMCADEVPFTSPAAFASATEFLDPVYRAQEPVGVFGECEAFGVRASSPIENEPVASAIPALVTSGEFDPVTPPSYGEEAARSLSASHVYTLHAQAHGATISPCGAQLLTSFLRDPTAPDAACVDELGGVVFESLRLGAPRFARTIGTLSEEELQRIREASRRFPWPPEF